MNLNSMYSDDQIERILYKPVCDALESVFPEANSFVDGLSSDGWQKVWNLITAAMEKGFEIGLTRGK